MTHVSAASVSAKHGLLEPLTWPLITHVQIIMGILDRSTTLTELIVRVSTRHRTSDVEVTVVDKGEDADSWIRDKVVGANLGSMLLGVDMEWKPNFCKGEDQNPVSLIQVAQLPSVLAHHPIEKQKCRQEHDKILMPDFVSTFSFPRLCKNFLFSETVWAQRRAWRASRDHRCMAG